MSSVPGRILPDPAATQAFGARVSALLEAGDVVTLTGDLGAGKTTLARGLLAGLGLAGEAPSPSFPIVLTYEPPELRLPLWHVDLYRLDEDAEVEELGLEDALVDAALLVEWPDRLPAWLRDRALALALVALPDGARRLTWTLPEAWEARWQRL